MLSFLFVLSSTGPRFVPAPSKSVFVQVRSDVYKPPLRSAPLLAVQYLPHERPLAGFLYIRLQACPPWLLAASQSSRFADRCCERSVGRSLIEIDETAKEYSTSPRLSLRLRMSLTRLLVD